MAEQASGPRPRLPPSDLGERPLPLSALGRDTWLRLHHEDYGAIFFSKHGRTRWDHRDGIGAMCVGANLAGIVLECFGDELRRPGGFLSHSNVCDYRVTVISIPKAKAAATRYLDLTNGDNLWKVGADNQLSCGSYAHSQTWSLAFMRHPSAPWGALYPSRHNSSFTNLVFFGHQDVIDGMSSGDSCALKDHHDFRSMLMRLGIGVSTPPPRHSEDWTNPAARE